MPKPQSSHIPTLSDRTDLDLTLVIDIGKSNAKWLMLDAAGAVLAHGSRANASVTSALGYPALDVQGLTDWLQQSVRASAHRQRCGHVIASTHGAALVALGDNGTLAWAPLDYEYAAIQSDPDNAAVQGIAAAACFRQTLSPDLPAGLNAGRQLDWLQNTHPQAWRATRCLMPYAQYWAWLLSGVASSEVSSLGCHTHLWNPVAGRFSDWAVTRGWAALFAPLRQAWETLGPVTRAVARDWGLPADCQVHVGVHDSNACLVRYLRTVGEPGPATGRSREALTVVSSGTWTVLMAPGAGTAQLDAAKDMLGNVDVTGRVTPTARFMGGREFAVLLDGAAPAQASLAALPELLASATYAVPSFAAQGGPFAARTGWVERGGQVLAGPLSRHLTATQRATLAALYCAQVTAWLTRFLWAEAQNPPAHGRLIVEGPLAHNPVFLALLQALLPQTRCFASTDGVEGTARGAWLLSRWTMDRKERGEVGADAPGVAETRVAGMELAAVSGAVGGADWPTETLPALAALVVYQAGWVGRLQGADV